MVELFGLPPVRRRPAYNTVRGFACRPADDDLLRRPSDTGTERVRDRGRAGHRTDTGERRGRIQTDTWWRGRIGIMICIYCVYVHVEEQKEQQ